MADKCSEVAYPGLTMTLANGNGIKELSVPDNGFISARPTITIAPTAADLPDAIPRAKRGKVPR
jgi:hypothetical protein